MICSNFVASELCRWLWAKLLRQELGRAVEFRDGARIRKQKDKLGPSGMSRNQAFALPEVWHGIDCLLPLRDDQLAVVSQIKQEMGGDEILQFNSAEYRQYAESVYQELGISELTFDNVWHVFVDMYAIVVTAERTR